MIIFDSGQQQVTLGEVIGTGGEATVYRIHQSQTLLAKIYSKEPRHLGGILGWIALHPL